MTKPMTKTVNVSAKRWKLGWELVLEGGGATQARTLAKAERQVCDYLDTVHPGADHGGWRVHIVPDRGNILAEVEDAKNAT